MSETPLTHRMLAAIRRRIYVARWVRMCLFCVCWLCVVAVLAMPVAWLLEGVDWRQTLLAIPVAIGLAVLLATLLVRRPDQTDAARAADGYAGTKDLFLTLTRLEASPRSGDDYAPLVLRDAESSAKRVNPRMAVPIPLERPLLAAAAGLLVALAAGLLVPLVDPFGTAAAAEVAAKEQKVLAALDKANEERKAELRKNNPEAELSKDVEQSVEQLKQSLKKLEAGKKEENQKSLAERQKELGAKWRKVSAESLKDLFDNRNSDQELGSLVAGHTACRDRGPLRRGRSSRR